jgi:DNA polymerase III epsilon subunit-like protein
MSIPEPVVPSTGFLGAGAEASGDERPHRGGSRRRYGRTRGAPPPGDWFVSRLGPANNEPWAAIDDPVAVAPRSRPAPNTPIDDLLFVAVDCETTGQTPHRLVELGAVAFTAQGHVASFETLVHCTDRINPYARRLHGITTAALAGAPRPDAVLERFLDFAAGAVLVEHSADAFDSRLLARTTGHALDADNVDTSRIAGKLWGLRDTIGLERLCGELGVVTRGPHTALGDAEATAAAFLELLDRCRGPFGWTTLADLLADAQPPPPRLVSMPLRRPGPPPAKEEAETDAPGADGEPRRRRRRGGRRRRRGAGTNGGAEATAVDPEQDSPPAAAAADEA